jgi:sialate O-acetylesterase
MRITGGISPYQTLQRNADGQAVIHCEGQCAGSGEVWAIVTDTSNEKTVVTKSHVVGSAKDGKWKAEIGEIPAGGPYSLTLEIRRLGSASGETIRVEHILVGDLWILAGQSNMQGRGDMEDVEPPSPTVHMFESRYQWAIAEEPLHRLSESPNGVHYRIFNPNVTREQIDKQRLAPRVPTDKGAGLGLPFAKELYRRTHVPIGLIPCAHGGTNMDQWDPARRDERGDSLYGSMYDRFQAIGGKVKGMLWYQGEAETSPELQPAYHAKLKRFIEAVRQDFNDPTLPFYLVQLSRGITEPTRKEGIWNGVQEDQRRIAQELPHVVTVPAIDLDLDDIIHVGTPGLKRLGRRLALVADRELFDNKKIDLGPQLKSVTLEKPGTIRVTYEHVNGSLAPPVHIAGFTLSPGAEFYDCKIDPPQPNSVLCQFAGELPTGAMMWYGKGLRPYCNLTDTQDMAASVFGPIPVIDPTTQPNP